MQHTYWGKWYWTAWLAALYCLLLFPAYAVAFASLFMMDNPPTSPPARSFLGVCILCCWLQLPALVISAAGLAFLGSEAELLAWLPLCIFGVGFIALFLCQFFMFFERIIKPAMRTPPPDGVDPEAQRRNLLQQGQQAAAGGNSSGGGSSSSSSNEEEDNTPPEV